MIWWWIGNIALLIVVVPVLLFYLNKVLRPVFEINSYANDVLEHGVGLTGTLDAVEKLNRTRELAARARQATGRYGSALERLL